MISKPRILVATLIGLTMLAALTLVVMRSGLIPWSTLVIGIGLLAKTTLKPANTDLRISIAFAIIPLLAWLATYYYVISTWESGEVVEITFDISDKNEISHTARVWILDLEPHPVIYYDADPDIAQRLLAGTPLQLSRNGELTTRIPNALRVEDLGKEESDRVLGAMNTKYGDRNSAATIYYLMLGRARERVAVVASLTPSPS